MPDATLIDALRHVLRLRRMALGIPRTKVAEIIDRDQTTIARFEQGRPPTWPDRTDRIVDAYAKALGVSALSLWVAAIREYARRRRLVRRNSSKKE